MNDVALFVIGGIVTALVAVGLVALWYAAVLDGRTEGRRTDEGARPGTAADADPSDSLRR